MCCLLGVTDSSRSAEGAAPSAGCGCFHNWLRGRTVADSCRLLSSRMQQSKDAPFTSVKPSGVRRRHLDCKRPTWRNAGYTSS